MINERFDLEDHLPGRFVILNCYFFTTLVMIVSDLFEVQKARLVANDFAVILRD